MNYKIIKNIDPKFLKIEGVQLDNSDFVFERLAKKSATCVLLLNHDSSKFFLVKQFRAGITDEIWEIPAGILEDSLTPEENTLKEIEEETGYNKEDIYNLNLLYSGFVSPGYTSENMYIFSANIKKGAIPGSLNLDEHENILDSGFFTFDEAKNMGAFKCMKTFLAATLIYNSNNKNSKG